MAASLRQQNQVSSFAGSSTLAFTSDVLVDSLIVVCMTNVGGEGTGVPFVAGDITKSSGAATIGIVTLDKARLETTAVTADKQAGTWSVPVTGGGSLTIAFNSITACLVCIQEWTGMNISVERVAGTSSNEANSTTPAAGSIFSNGPGVFIGALDCFSGADITITIDGNFTSLFEQETYDPSDQGAMGYKIVTGNETWDINWTLGSGVVWVAVVVIYKESAGPEPSSSIAWIRG